MDKIKKIKVLLGMVKAEFATAKLLSGDEISFDSLEINREVYDSEGNPLKEGSYTLEDGKIITVDENGVIKEIQNPATDEETKEEVVEEKMEEVTTEVKEEEVVVEEPVVEKTIEDRVGELESKVDEIYNLLLQITEKEREREEKITEIKEEFALVKNSPSATPVFVSSEKNENKPISKVEKLKRLLNQ